MRYSSGQVHQAPSQRAAFMVYFLEVGSFGAQIIESCEQCSLGLSRAAALTPGTVRHEYMAHMDGAGGGGGASCVMTVSKQQERGKSEGLGVS